MLLPRTAVIVTACCLAVALAACSSPNGPSTSLVGSRPTSPSTGSTFSYYSQPVTLGVASGVTTGGTLLSIVEVATDAAFTTVMTTKTVDPMRAVG
jgi:ABC-type oligopeptide transport system substrate-binding subunit